MQRSAVNQMTWPASKGALEMSLISSFFILLMSICCVIPGVGSKGEKKKVSKWRIGGISEKKKMVVGM